MFFSNSLTGSAQTGNGKAEEAEVKASEKGHGLAKAEKKATVGPVLSDQGGNITSFVDQTNSQFINIRISNLCPHTFQSWMLDCNFDKL